VNEEPNAHTPSLQEVRSYWDARPCNIRHSTAPVGTREYFDQVDERRYFVEPHIIDFAEFDRWAGKSVLEVGCGIGSDTIRFARAGASVTAVELSTASLNIARQRAEVYGLSDHIRFLEGDAENLSSLLPEETFDLIYSFGVLHHTPDPAAAIQNLRKLCSPTTELRIMLYARNSWKDAMIRAGLDQPEAASGCPIASTYTEAEATDLLEGFRIMEMRQDHIFPYVIESYVNHAYEVQPWFACMPPAMLEALKRSFGWHLLIRAVPDEGR
jgi:SAM-dependent methyltransferase